MSSGSQQRRLVVNKPSCLLLERLVLEERQTVVVSRNAVLVEQETVVGSIVAKMRTLGYRTKREDTSVYV